MLKGRLPVNALVLVISVTLYRLNCTYFINDSSAEAVEVKLENDLEMNVNVRPHFYIPVGEYEAENGEVVNEKSSGRIKKIDVDASIVP